MGMQAVVGYVGYWTACTVVAGWVCLAMALLLVRAGVPGPRVRRWRAVGSELSPFIPVASLVAYLSGVLVGVTRQDGLMELVLFLLFWAVLRRVFDDRWKRRRQRLAARLAGGVNRLFGATAGA